MYDVLKEFLKNNKYICILVFIVSMLVTFTLYTYTYILAMKALDDKRESIKKERLQSSSYYYIHTYKEEEVV